MQRHPQYIMRDQVTDRVRTIMGERRGSRLRRATWRGGRNSRTRWLALLAIAASTAGVSLGRGPFG